MEFEMNIIACILIKPELLKELTISIDYFKSFEARLSLQILSDQYKKYGTVSLVGIEDTYSHLFKSPNDSKAVIEYLTECITLEATANNFSYYQEQLFSANIKNKILNTIHLYEQKKIDTETLLEEIHKLESLSMNDKTKSLNPDEIYSLITESSKKINFRFKKLTLNANIQEHDLVVLAARPGVGKTAFALNLLEDISNEYNCVYFNLEMSEQQIYRRLMSIHSNIDLKYIEKPAGDFQKEKILEYCNKFSKKKIKVITGSQSLRSLKAKMIKESKKSHTMIFIDYVGLVAGKDGQSNYERVTEITKELRRISLDFNCTIFLISQINRSNEKQKDKRPQISDLKESGELEQSGTSVLMLHSENIYSENDEEEIQLIIGKNRNGKVGYLKYKYNKSTQRFEEK